MWQAFEVKVLRGREEVMLGKGGRGGWRREQGDLNPLPHGRRPISPTVIDRPIAQKVLKFEKFLKLLYSSSSPFNKVYNNRHKKIMPNK
jgi:hypothetical protein